MTIHLTAKEFGKNTNKYDLIPKSEVDPSAIWPMMSRFISDTNEKQLVCEILLKSKQKIIEVNTGTSVSELYLKLTMLIREYFPKETKLQISRFDEVYQYKQ